jgi:hypothetical protein
MCKIRQTTEREASPTKNCTRLTTPILQCNSPNLRQAAAFLTVQTWLGPAPFLTHQQKHQERHKQRKDYKRGKHKLKLKVKVNVNVNKVTVDSIGPIRLPVLMAMPELGDFNKLNRYAR